MWKILEKIGLAEVDNAPEEKAVEEKTAVEPIVKVSSKTITQTNPDQFKAIDDEARQRLSAAIENVGAKSFEEFVGLLETLQDAIPDEQKRYVTALNILVKKGGSAQIICADLDKCIGVLEDKSREFTATLKSQLDNQVGSRVKKEQDCKDQIQKKREQIATIQSEITNLEKQQLEAAAGISEETIKINTVKERFEFVYRDMKSKIEGQRNKIAQYGANL